MIYTPLLNLAILTSSVIGAAIESRDAGHVNYYSDPRCKSWIGQWQGPDQMYDNADYDAGGAFIGSVLMLPSDTFDSLTVNGHGIVSGGLCPGDSQVPILVDANGFSCYVINQEVSKVELYSAICAVIPSKE
ncbi:hypothetical protein B0J13DRAFT_677847 [Dactylonectria estremocensis]|uniref:Uncharacterized protein n=1 Tax=Dactylonectria estremocensis TaxID=1079267 RepID=A0A9P9E8H6_9HYPO|nr:hypothetical protein B0J13DRAFT_677847 [Dactylonectria estremocensis]